MDTGSGIRNKTHTRTRNTMYTGITNTMYTGIRNAEHVHYNKELNGCWNEGKEHTLE